MAKDTIYRENNEWQLISAKKWKAKFKHRPFTGHQQIKPWFFWIKCKPIADELEDDND